jgi:hypothetical protein
MDWWQLIFSQSKVNNGAYDGDRLPDHHWVWPEQTWFQRRRSCLRKAAPSSRGSRPDATRKEQEETRPLSFTRRAGGVEAKGAKIDRRPHSGGFSVVPLLLAEEQIPAEARRALVENRLLDAARLLMREYGLSCTEAGDLLDVSTCNGS